MESTQNSEFVVPTTDDREVDAVSAVAGAEQIDATNNEESTPFTKRKRKKTSGVWEHFRLVKLLDGTDLLDNAKTNDVVVRKLMEKLNLQKKLVVGGKLFHVRCCAHILNLLVQDGLGEIEDIIHNVRESVKHVNASPGRLHNFSKLAKQLSMSNKHLILDVATRWNATYAMLSTALEFKEVFLNYADRESTYTTLLSKEDWKKVEEFSFNAIYSHDEAPKQMQIVQDTLYELYQEYVEAHKIANVVSSSGIDGRQGVSTGSTSMSGFSSLTSWFGKCIKTGTTKYDQHIRSVGSFTSVKSELDIYLEDEIYIGESGVFFDALGWWKENNLKFRILSNMAANILAILITTVASKSAFTAGRRVIDSHHSSLGTKVVDMLICGADWLGLAILRAVDNGNWILLHMACHVISLSHLFFADDLILYAKPDLDQACVMKGILDEFEEDLSNVREIVRNNIVWLVGDDNDVHLWNDTWVLTLGLL
ncbi:hypothetical protein V6N12_058709 [Hibiscus sabdariffa]|uniref:HAT C-terminal dimerisation domain-containing protein n=1 Tax=Hibiscus sabdariffa TaxID=183260 RepID=A0ABR2ESY1_9ROSI